MKRKNRNKRRSEMTPDELIAARARDKLYRDADPERKKRMGRGSNKSAAKYPEKRRARQCVRNAVKKGLLIRPTTCSECKCEAQFIEAHHADYSKPLEVVWLCKPCHSEVDLRLERQLRAGANPQEETHAVETDSQ